jgi:hypothetical protein
MPGIVLDSEDPKNSNPQEIINQGQEIQVRSQRGDLTAVQATEEVAAVAVVLRPRIAIATNISPLSGLGTYQAVSLADGNMVMLFGQTDQAENGPYIVHATINGVVQAWTRPALPFGPGSLHYVTAGTYAGQYMVNTNVVPIVYGTTLITLTNLSAAGGAPGFHAATHKEGGADALLSAPGRIGRLTPSSVRATALELPAAGAPGGSPANLTQLFALAGVSLLEGLAILAESGQIVGLRNRSASPTCRTTIDTFCQTIANNGTYDYDNQGLSGFLVVVVQGATATNLGIVSFAANGATDLGGQTWPNIAITATPGSLVLAANAGKVRLTNTLGLGATVLGFAVLGSV